MKILIATSGYPPQVGGVEQVTARLAREFVRAGNKVAVVAPRVTGEPNVKDIDGVKVWRLPYPMPQWSPRDLFEFVCRYPLGAKTFDRIVTEFRPDVINSHFATTTNTLYSITAARMHKLPLVVSLHGEDVQRMPQMSTSWRYTALAAIRRADALIACSDYLRLQAGKLHKKALSAKVIRNGIDLSEFRSQEHVGDAHHAEILAVGRFVHKKGFDVLLDSFRYAADRLSWLRLVIVGEGSEEQSLREQADRLGLGSRVTILTSAPRATVVEMIKKCMAVVVPSRVEPLGIVNMEAMAAGKPVIACQVGGIPELIVHRKNGLLVPPEDPQALAVAMLEIARDPELRARLGEEGRRQAHARYDWSEAAGEYLRCFDSVICPDGKTFNTVEEVAA